MSRTIRVRLQATFIVAAALLAACSSGGRREIEILAEPNGCTPTSITVQRSEALTLVVRNEAGADREIEGIEGTRLEEVLVPDGRTRRIDYTMPEGSDLQKVKCYISGGSSTEITLTTGGTTAP